MKSLVRALCLLVSLSLVGVMLAIPALAGARPVVSSLSAHRGTYWGGRTITVHGRNFTHVRKVMFGAKQGHHLHVVSSTRLTVRDPWHKYGTTNVRVVTSTGWSAKTSANRFTFTRPTMNSHIQGGLTGRQEQQISAYVRKAHRGVHTSPRSSHWTAAMGATAVSRARSWLGLPYSWAGGNAKGPTAGVCAHNGGDLDCHIVGFDCSGLTLYTWSPYVRLAHYAATQHSRAGRFHPAVGQLVPGDLVFFSGYISGGIGHTAIYEGNGNVIQAEQSGTWVMRSRLTDVIAYSGTYRGATRPASTGRQSPGPRLTSVTPYVSIKGGYLTVTGSQLATATSVVIGGKTFYAFARRTSTQLVVRVPAHRAGRVSVAVSNPWGTANTAVSYASAPHVSSLSPARGPITGGTAVTIAGANLSAVTAVTVGATPVRFQHVSASRLTVTMPAHLPGVATVTLTSAVGSSNRVTYTYVALPPTSPPPTIPPSTSSAPPSSIPPSTTATSPPTSAAPTVGPPSTSTTAVPPAKSRPAQNTQPPPPSS